jgi:hypothetical protein
MMDQDINDAIGFLGYLHGKNGEPEKAFQRLERLDSMAFINVLFIFDPIREDPGFVELVKRMGLIPK